MPAGGRRDGRFNNSSNGFNLFRGKFSPDLLVHLLHHRPHFGRDICSRFRGLRSWPSAMIFSIFSRCSGVSLRVSLSCCTNCLPISLGRRGHGDIL